MTIENSTVLPAATTVNLSPNSASLQTSAASDSGGFTDALTAQLNTLNGNNVSPTVPQVDPLPLLRTGETVAATPEILEVVQGITPSPVNVDVNVQTGKILPQDATNPIDEKAQQALEAVLQFLYPPSTQSSSTASSTTEAADGEPAGNNLAGDSEDDTVNEGIVDPSTILPLPVNNIIQQPQARGPVQSSTSTLPQDSPAIAGQKPALSQVLPQAGDKAGLDDKSISLGLTKVSGDQATVDDKGTAFNDVIKLALDNQQGNADSANFDAVTFKDGGQNINTAQGIFAKNAENSVSSPAGSHPAPIKAEIGHPEWQSELGDRIVWLNNKSITSAEIQLNPEHLGPISIKIDLKDDQASIAFTAQHVSVREALEASIPKLKELFHDQQLNLGQVNISQQFSPGQGQQQSFHQQQTPGFTGQPTGETQDINPEHAIENTAQQALVSKGLLSLYA